MNRPPGKSRNLEGEAKPVSPPPLDRGISRWKMALGAASLFFFVVGVKRSFRTDDGREILQSDADDLDEPAGQARVAGRTSTATGSPAVSRSRGRDEVRSRSAKGGRLSTLLEMAERDSRSPGEIGRGRTSEKGSRSGRASLRGSDPGQRRSR